MHYSIAWGDIYKDGRMVGTFVLAGKLDVRAIEISHKMPYIQQL